MDPDTKNGAIPLDRTFFVGVDLGQRESHTAIVVLERFDQKPSFERILAGSDFLRRYVVRQAERVPLGTPYPDVVTRLDRIATLLGQLGLCIVVVDGTGIGVPVVELMKQRTLGGGCRILPIVITSGQSPTPSSVPRSALIGKLQVMAQLGELEIAHSCRDGPKLQEELAHLTLDRATSSSSQSDDLALALALACWRAKVR